MTTVLYRTLDPRNNDEARTANEAVFSLGPVFGIEVTVPALAARCTLGNLDPQHGVDLWKERGVDIANPPAAIEIAMRQVWDPANFTEDVIIFATVRADLDALGTMVVIASQIAGEDISAMNERAMIVAKADAFANGGWNKSELPSSENLWPAGAESASDSEVLAPIAAAVADFKVSLDQRVEWMKSWLLTGDEPAGYHEKVEAERKDLVKALDTGAVKVSQTHNDKVVVVITTHRAATMIGYAHAPIVVALNPEFRYQGGDPHRKFTVCQFTADYVDLIAIKNELAALEAEWGGSPTIIGSPQGVMSNLSVEKVTEIVIKHLKSN